MKQRGEVNKVVVMGKAGKTFLMGVAESGFDMVNFKVEYDIKTLDFKGFFSDLKEQLANDLDVAVGNMDIREGKIVERMERYERCGI